MAEEGSTPTPAETAVEDAPPVAEDAAGKAEEPAAESQAEPAVVEAPPEEAAPAAEEAAPAAEEAAPAAEEAAPAAEEAAPAAEEAAPAAEEAAPAAEEAAPAADEGATATEEAAPTEVTPEETAEPFPEILSTRSLVAKHVTEVVWNKLSTHKTVTSGFTLSKAIACAVQFDDQNCGIYAGDWDSYKDFSAVFDPIIQDYHGISADSKHTTDMDVSKITGNIDADAPVKSTRIRVGRSVDGFGLSPGILKEHRLEFEEMMKTVFSKLEGDLAGTYYPLSGMEETTRQQLVDDHFLFMSGDKNLIAAGMERDWPEGRGIFHNATKTFLVWVNEEDQLRIISMAQGSDVRGVFELLVKGINAIEECIKTDFNKSIMLDEKYGYIHSCPTNLGTGMRASVHVDLPGYTKEGLASLKKRCEELHLQPRGTRGESGGHIDATYDISNKHRLGYSEVELVQKLIDGVNILVKEDKQIMEDLSPKETVAADAPVEAAVESETAVTDVDSGPAAEVTADEPASEAPATPTPVEAETPAAADETPVQETPAEAAPAEAAPAEETATEEPVTAVEPAPAAPVETPPDVIAAAEPPPPAAEPEPTPPAPKPAKKSKTCSIL